MTVELRWPGKYDPDGRRAELPTRTPRARLLERFGPGSDGDGHRLLWGDNLAALELLEAELERPIDLAYIDPPFGTGGSFEVSTRVGESDGSGGAREIGAQAYHDRFDTGRLLEMLDPRIRRIHRLLADHGSLYVHVDPIEGHAVKLLLDDVFGPQCFQREIVWRIGWVSGFKTQARNWIRNHDLIFFYTKAPKGFTFNKAFTPYPPGYRRRDGSLPRGRGVPLDDVWNANESEFALRGRESLDSIQIKSFSPEKSGYATQKNVSLLRRIIEASSNPGDLVLDAFCGSGTSGVAAAELGRRFVGCDIHPAAVHIATKRLLGTAHGTSVRVDRVDVPTEPDPRRGEGVPVPEVRLDVTQGRDHVVVELVGFEYEARHGLSDEVVGAVHKWSDWVDAWWVVAEEPPATVLGHAFRTHRDRELALRIRVETVGRPGLSVRITDILYRQWNVRVAFQGDAEGASSREIRCSRPPTRSR